MIAAVACSVESPLYTPNPSDFTGLDGLVDVIAIWHSDSQLRSLSPSNTSYPVARGTSALGHPRKTLRQSESSGKRQKGWRSGSSITLTSTCGW